jgi:thioredoxin reductase (NADPH)
MYFSRFAKNVTMLVRGQSLSKTMSQYLIDQIGETDCIEVWTETEVREAMGDDRLEQLVLSSEGGKSTKTVPASGLFIFVGAVPHTDWLGAAVARDEHGFILSGPEAQAAAAARALRDVPEQRMPRRSSGWLAASTATLEPPVSQAPYLLETSLPGVFVAGDVRHGSVKRVASAVGEGSMAVMYVHLYLNST